MASQLQAQPDQKTFKGKGPWYEQTASGEINLHLYFFWSKECPHCRRAKPFLQELQAENPWVLLHQKEVTEYPENKKLFIEMVDSFGETSRAVPTLMFCGGMIQGFDKPENSGKQLAGLLNNCRTQLTSYLAPPEKLPELPTQKAGNQFSVLKVLAIGTLLMLGIGVFIWRKNRMRKETVPGE